MSPRQYFLLMLLPLLVATSLHAASSTAVRELGQPDFAHFVTNRVDGRGLSAPSGVAIDRSRTPNGIWVLDANNHRALGWRDEARAAAGAPADVVVGQPDLVSSGCNNGGLSAKSLCLLFHQDSEFNRGPGLAVDGEGNLWVADRANFRVLGYRRPFDTDAVADAVIGQDGFSEWQYPSERGPRRGIDPSELATDAEGDLFIVDTERVVELDRPFASDTQLDRVYGQSTLDAFDDIPPAEAVSLSRIPKPSGVAVDGEGRLYVGDTYTDRVLVWDAPLALLGSGGPANHEILQEGHDCGQGCFDQPSKAVAVAPNGDLWVGELVFAGIFGKVFGYRSPFGPGGDASPDRVLPTVDWANDTNHATDGQLRFGGGAMAVDGSGTLWVTDFHRVLGFRDPWNAPITADRVIGQVRLDEWSANLVDGGGLGNNEAIALDTSVAPPHIYVSDHFNSRVLGWADAANFVNGQPADLVIGQPDEWSTGCNRGGRSLVSLCLYGIDYAGLAVDRHGTLWVADHGNSRVLGYRTPFVEDAVADRVLGQRDASSIGCGRGRRGLCVPGGVAVDADDNVYVADIFNNRIVEFDDPLRRDGVADHVIGSRPTAADCHDVPTCFYQQTGSYSFSVYGGPLAVDAAGRLLVGNSGRVYVFDHPRRAVPRARVLIELSATDFAPFAITTDSSDRVYVTGQNVVRRFRADGVGPDVEIGERCPADEPARPIVYDATSLCAPKGVAVSPSGELFVSDAFAHRVVVYDVQ